MLPKKNTTGVVEANPMYKKNKMQMALNYGPDHSSFKEFRSSLWVPELSLPQ